MAAFDLPGIGQQGKATDEIQRNFQFPPASAKPWVFWYWMHGAVSKQGITADLEAMQKVGIGGAYLMPLRDSSSSIPFSNPVRQLTAEWWEMVRFAMSEAKRLGLQLGMHVSDGFALAGGPWISPELSMQKLAWTKTYVQGAQKIIRLKQPEALENYYRDIAVFAYPLPRSIFQNARLPEKVVTSTGEHADFLADTGNKKLSFRSDTTCWIQYEYAKPFTCRSIKVHVGGNSYQAQRLEILVSDDGKTFRKVHRLIPPRHGWQDTDEDYTHAIPAITAKYFRFIYDKQGSEPGSEDLDAAKWKPSLKLTGLYLGSEPVIHQYEAKNGSVWRVAANTTTGQVPDKNAIALKSILDLTKRMHADGTLDWSPPAATEGSTTWVIVRIGHTSTGHTNYTGGAALGLECDKFNPAAVRMQFDNWFGKVFERIDPSLTRDVLKAFHVDSWECGSQNWTKDFALEFKKRKGYDLVPYLLVMTGVPITSAAISEKVLHDVREVIAALVNDVFYSTLKTMAHAKGCDFSAEAIAPTMVSDGLEHYKMVDLPMGEFWFSSPTHDKPNDMLDAISGAHIYGKNVVQAESFTTLRMDWSEHPGKLKEVGDRNFALGMNKIVFHVFTHNPWIDRKPGMTLGPIGLYFQRDQTWFRQSKPWIDYLTRTSALLQLGKPVVDIAVFTGEELPRRSILPDRLVSTLPGIFGKEIVQSEAKRLANTGQPLRTVPDGVTHSANMADPENWINGLNGYKYDCINPDALLSARVEKGRIVLPGGPSYRLLVIPLANPMQPDSTSMSISVARKLLELLDAGVKVIMKPTQRTTTGFKQLDSGVQKMVKTISNHRNLVLAPFEEHSFSRFGIEKELEFEPPLKMAWTHRSFNGSDIYFLSNQSGYDGYGRIDFTDTAGHLRILQPQNGELKPFFSTIVNGKRRVTTRISPAESMFIVVSREYIDTAFAEARESAGVPVTGEWQLQFDTAAGGPAEPVSLGRLVSWSDFNDPRIRYYSGTATYSNNFEMQDSLRGPVYMSFDSIFNIARVYVNGIECGTIWTRPYRVDIGEAVKKGLNEVRIEVTNTWANRLIGDQNLPADKRITWTTAPFRLANKPLLPAGLTGNVQIEYEK